MPRAHVPPYTQVLLDAIARGEPEVTRAFGRHMHWGWWERPDDGDGSPDDFTAAAERMCHRMFDTAGIRDGERVLDVGCGLGGTLASLDARFSGVSLVGLNIDARQLERAREQVRPRPENQVEFVEGDACAMPFPDASFDVLVALECIFHFPDRGHFFQEAHRVLRPGGRLVLSDFVPTRALVPALSAQDILFGAYQRRFAGSVDIRYPLKRYRTLARETGFAPVAEDDVTMSTLPTYKVVRRLLPRFGSDSFLRVAGLLSLEFVTRLGLLRYMILSYERR